MTLPILDTHTDPTPPLSGVVWARFGSLLLVMLLLMLLLMLASPTACNPPAETLSAQPDPDKILTQSHKEL